MKLEQLRARLAAIKTDMQVLIDGEMSAEDSVKFDELEAEAKQVQSNIERLERFEKMKEQEQEPQGRKVPASAPQRIEVVDNASADLTGGFSGLGEFAMAVRASNPHLGGSIDPRLNVLGAPSNFHKEGGSSDGYMVPTEYKNKIFELVFGNPDLLGMVDSEPTSSNSVQFLADETTPWGSTGIQAYWGAEGNQFTPSRLETEGKELKLHKLHAFVTATEELIEDAPRLNSRLTKGAAQAINWKANEAILFGSGAGQPLGFDNSASKITVAKEGTQAADTIVAANVAKMYTRILNPSRAVWFVNQDTLPQFLTMTLGDKPIWLAPNGFISSPGGVLFGRPVMFNEHCGTLGDNTDIMLIDPMGYYLLKKSGGVKFASSIHLYFDYDIQAFKWTFRLGGMPYLNAAVSPNKGSSTKSHYVTLAVR
jgi:HK97 family phage major capsid protein